MAESLAKSGIFLDDLNKIRVLEPEVSQHTSELKEKSKEFVEGECYKIKSNFHVTHQNRYTSQIPIYFITQ